MQQPANQAPIGLFAPGQQAFAPGNQGMQQSAAAQPACGLYSNGCQAMQPQQHHQGAVARQQHQPLSAGTGSAGARNPFAAMPRELRNSQLRSNLAAVAGAFSACSGAAPGGRGASPPAPAARPSMVPPPPQQHQQWPAPAVQSTAGAAGAAAGLVSSPGMYMAASSGMDVLPAQLPVSGGMAGPSCHAGLQQAYATTSSSSSMAAPFSAGLAGAAYTSPLPMPVQSSYLHQQQHMVMHQQDSMHPGFYSDPLPYLGNVAMPAMAMPPSQQQQQAQHALLFASQGLPAGLMTAEPASMAYPAAAAAGGDDMSQAQLLLQKQQQALHQLQAMEQMMMLRLLPDA